MVSAIILAAGKSSRMKKSMRKQYLDLSGQPILTHSVRIFDRCDLVEEIFLVVPEEDIEYCQNKILSLLKLNRRINLVCGGNKRQDSVYNGLQALNPYTKTVVIHDGARPFLHPQVLEQCILESKIFGACILGTPATDTLKSVYKSEIVKTTVPRENIWLAQTPQAFQYDIILKAHEAAKQDRYVGTDDASLVERLGEDVKIIYGGEFNIKITNKEDLAVARAMLDAGLI